MKKDEKKVVIIQKKLLPLCLYLNKITVIRNITTYGYKNRQFKRISKHINEKREEGFGDPQFFKTVQNRADIEALFGKIDGVHILLT